MQHVHLAYVFARSLLAVVAMVGLASFPGGAVARAQDPVMLAMSMFSHDQPPPPPAPVRPKPKDSPSPSLTPGATPPAVAVPVTPAPGLPGSPSPGPAATNPGLPKPPPPVGSAPTSPGPAPAVTPGQALPGGTMSKPAGDLLNSASSGDGYSYDPKTRRDPFLSMVKMLKASQARAELPPLQRVELSDVKLIGVVSDHSGYYGLIQTPDGKGYTVRVGTLMGTNNGTIKTISEQKVIVAEPSLDITGKMTTRDIEILQRPKEGTE